METRARPRARRAGAALLLAAFGISLAAGAGELVLRLVGYRTAVLLPNSARAGYRLGPDEDFLYLGYLPGAVEDFATRVHLNHLGFHDRDYARERPSPNTYRIMVLGDSYVAAWEVPLEETFHKRLEARLNAEDPLGRGSYQVIAFGQGRTAQEREVEWLRQYGPEYLPDLVLVVFFSGNDLMENSPEIFARASGFGVRYIRKVVPRKIAFFQKLLLFSRSRLNGLAAERLAELYEENLYRFDPGVSKDDLESPELGVYRVPLTPEWQKAFDRTEDLLGLMRRETEKLGARFVLATLSGPQAMGELAERTLWSQSDPRFDYTRPERWIEDWARRSGIPLLALGPRLAAVGRRKVFWPHDQHLNSHGHELLAKWLYDFLLVAAQNR